MTLQNILNRLTKVVLEEAARNPQFKTALNDALGISTSKKQTSDEKIAAHLLCLILFNLFVAESKY